MAQKEIVLNIKLEATEAIQQLKALAVTGDTRSAVLLCPEHVAQSKPAPDMLLLACQQMALQPGEVLFVGDDERDIAAGRAAGCRTAAVTWGYIHPEDHPSHWGADVIVITARAASSACRSSEIASRGMASANPPE